MLLALDHLHAKGIVYNDLKPANIGIINGCQVKLFDLGSAQLRRLQQQEQQQQEAVHSIAVTPWIMSPELAAQDPIITTTTPADDMWAVGVLVYQLMTGSLPWTDDDDAPDAYDMPQLKAYVVQQLKDASKQPPVPSGSASADFVRACMCRDVGKRLTVQQAMQHPWVSGS